MAAIGDATRRRIDAGLKICAHKENCLALMKKHYQHDIAPIAFLRRMG